MRINDGTEPRLEELGRTAATATIGAPTQTIRVLEGH